MASIPTNRKILFFSVIVLFFLAIDIPAQEKKFGLITVVNKAASLTIVSIVDRGPITEARERGFGNLTLYDITIRNDYDKPIEVYKLEGWDETTGEPTNEPPRGTFLTKWTIAPKQQIHATFISNTGGKTRLVVEAVIFNDGSGDGDAVTVASLQEQRSGISLAYRELIPILRDVLKMPLTTTEQIRQLREKIDNVYPEKGASKNIAEGFEIAKFYIRSACYRLEHPYGGEAPKTTDLLMERLSEMETGLSNFSEP